ncbi:AMP-binding enzyme family protein [Collimonas fungivorans]|uniref:AMP-binding enzyme family protein n=1 Tax=Collimonas fungivorans TaxID=158899 RepID=A0A127P4V4_9BURK|nr:fatty acyl-AMP ligase [Collimonas fungivorans]AMO92777.1 AMP-binding enzyme family protein [Collimonas fungivorans]
MTSSLSISEAVAFAHGQSGPESSIAAAAQDIDMDAILRRRAAATPDAVALRFLKNGEDDIAELTYRQLDLRAARLARQLKQQLAPGARVLLVLEPGLNYVTALFAIFKAGATAVPSFPPVGSRAVARFASICNDCNAQLVIAEGSLHAAVDRLNASLSAEGNFPEWLFAGSDFFEAQDTQPIAADATDDVGTSEPFPALLQYTSGSTGNPKGVVLSAANLISNSRVLDIRLGSAEKHIGFTWLPPYHDMGLMGALLLSVYSGFTLVVMTPAHFVQRPLRWLKGLSTHRVTTSVAPNFALDLCVDTITDEEIAELDLSRLKMLFCGAEPVRQATLDRFSEKFKAAGFSSAAFVPCYGLAEATLFISGKANRDAIPKTLLLDHEALACGQAKPATADAPATAVISCGTVASGHVMAIVDPDTRQQLPAGAVGELWFKGASVAQAYLNQPEASTETFHAFIADDRQDGPYLRTGDLGFMLDDELYITGRIKDVIIFAGRNLYPQDIEAAAQASHPAIRTNGVAAFSVTRDDTEQLVVVAEILRSAKLNGEDLENVEDAIAAAITRSHGVAPHTVHLAPVSTIPLTTSGKVRRSACRDAFNAGSLAYAKARPTPSATATETDSTTLFQQG